MFIDKLMNKFGYSEMYEWSELFNYDIIPYGRFVTFDENEPGKIKLANKNDYIIGVTTINTVCTSDDPEEWQGKYLCNGYGDYLLQENKIDNDSYEYMPITNDIFDKELEYKKRSDRYEWVRVNLLGKCIVADNGECESGNYCEVGTDGIAVPSKSNSKEVNKYYIISRLTDNTIMIFFK